MRRHSWRTLSPGDIVEIIAPANKVTRIEDLATIRNLLSSWGFEARMGKNIIGNHPLCSNTEILRFHDLKDALYNEDSHAIWCYRGGYGCTELLPMLAELTPPRQPKLFIGFSDITVLLTFFQQQWQWPTIHGPGGMSFTAHLIDEISQNYFKDLLQGKLEEMVLTDLQPLNNHAKNIKEIRSSVTGGNLSLISHTLGTPYQIKPEKNILFLEDVNEPAYKIRRKLVHLQQASIFKNIDALLFGTFTHKAAISQNENDLIQSELIRFAEEQAFPVLQTHCVGHGKVNYPLPLNTAAVLTQDKSHQFKLKINII